MRSTVRSAGLILASLVASAPLGAQGGAPVTRTGISITPYLGVIVPTADLVDYNNQTTKLSAAIVFGGRLGIGFGQRFRIEGDVGYSPASLEYASAGTNLNQDVRVLTGSARANLYLIPRTSPFWIGINGGIGAAAGIRIGRLVALHIGADDYFYNASFDVSGTKTSEKKQHDIRITGGVRVPFLGF